MSPHIENVAITAVIPYEFNNKIHGEAEVDRIANSISEFGWTYPILIDDHNIILAGHKRLAAAKKLGLAEVPVIRKPGLTDAQKKAYRIIDNKSSQESEWDLKNLDIELKTLEEMKYEVERFIKNDFDFSSLDETKLEEDEVPETTGASTISLGDVFTLGEHRVVCGDSTKTDVMALLLKNQSADLLVTDPPYNVDYVGKTKEALQIKNDKMDDATFRNFLTSALSNAASVLRGGGIVLYFSCRWGGSQLSACGARIGNGSQANHYLE